MKVLSYPGDGNSCCCIVVNWTMDNMFQFAEDIPPLIQEVSSVLTNR